MLATLIPREGGGKQAVSDAAALSDLRRDLPKLALTFPQPWSCEVGSITIDRGSSGKAEGVLEIGLTFRRSDLETIYRATKLAFGMMAEGRTSERDFAEVPADLRNVDARDSARLVECVGQVFGCASGYVNDCESAVSTYRAVLLGRSGGRIGAVSISAANLARILAGDVPESDTRSVAGMYRFE
jgi:hypothetical protein